MVEIDPGIIDSNVLMQRIRMSVSEKKIPKTYFGAEDDTIKENPVEKEKIFSLQNKIRQLSKIYAIEEKPIVSNRPVIGKLIVAVKKTYRKLTRWLFASYYQQQTAINELTLQTIQEMLELQEMLVADTYRRENGEKKNAD